MHAYRPLLRPATSAAPAGWIYLEAPPDIAHHRRDLPSSTYRHGVIGYAAKLERESAARFDLEYLGERLCEFCGAPDADSCKWDPDGVQAHDFRAAVPS